MLDVSDLRIGIGAEHPVDGLSFKLAAGHRLGLIGQPGSGKSLVARALSGLLPDANVSGTITFGGTSLDAAELRRKDIAVLPQGDPPDFDPLLKAGDLLADPAAFEAVGLKATDASRYAGSLSPVERQLLFIALALSREPKLLIADEPFRLLDGVAQRRVVELLRKTSESKGMAVLLASHDFKTVAALCTEIIILGGGKLVESGPTAEIFSRPKQDYSKLLIAGGRTRARTLMRSPIGTDLAEIHNLDLSYRHPAHRLFKPHPVVALDNVSFSIRRGEALAVVGPARSGKSALARLVAGLDRAQTGTIVYERQPYRGRDLPRLLRGEIAFVFDDPRKSLNPRLTLGASVAEPLRLETHLIMDEQADRLVDVVRAAGLAPEQLELYPADISLADLQRLAIARAMIARPKLVIFDEPVRLLDASQRGDILMLINRLRADFGFTALLTANDFDLIRNVADRVLVMDNGRIVEEGTPGALIESPSHPVTKTMIEARFPEVGIGVVAPVGL
jgi:peptide/nickel transport system ATP-binding protein